MRFLSIFLLMIPLAILPVTASAAKTDLVLLVNGNAVTGEIKSLDFGALSYSTDSMGTVSIKWEEIVSITTKQTLQVEVSNGTFYFGRLDSADERFEIKVRTLSGDVDLPTSAIVKMTPIDAEESFWSRLEGSFSLGFDTEKSSDVTTLRSATDVRYRTQQYLVGLTATFNVTAQATDETVNRTVLGLNYQRFRGNRWFTEWYGGWDRHDELGIDSRYQAGAGLGRYMIQTNKNQLSLQAGLNAAHQSFTGIDDSTNKLEGRIQLRFLHRKIQPEANIIFTSNYYPLLEDFSQFRVETDLILRREFYEDLFFDVTMTHSYNSDPPSGGEKDDYIVTTSIGYSW